MMRRLPPFDVDRRHVMVANPSADVYGSDLQMMQSVCALVAAGYEVTVTTPDDGPLIPQLEQAGAAVHRLHYPVLRRAMASPRGIISIAARGAASVVRLTGFLRQRRPDALYVNTVTLPWWILAGRAAGVPVVCHVHEAERSDARAIQLALNLPLLAAHRVIIISRAALETLTQAVPALDRRTTLIYNGVAGPAEVPTSSPGPRSPFRLVLVARLSPRKGVDVALDALGLVRRQGYDCVLEVCGTAFSGYEWFVDQLHARASQPDLSGAVTFSGYVNPVWPKLAAAHAALAPSLREPFGNAVVEAQLASRPVIASAAMGHLETIRGGETGLLVQPDDAQSLAAGIVTLIEDPDRADQLARAGREEATQRFSVERYDREICAVVDELVGV